MWLDVIDLRDFYKDPRGQWVRRLLSRQIQNIWPHLAGQRVLGLGFATPYLPDIADGAERVLAVMPPGQGVMRWPEDGPNRVCLAEEYTLPLPDRSIDRLLIVHCLEGSAELRLLMRECWRVLADGGRVLVVVANRSSLWARAESSPFAHGRPYSQTQIMTVLRDGMFAPRQALKALFVPPGLWRLFGRGAAAFERFGARWLPTFAGVHIVEAEKQIYAAPWDAMPAAAKKAPALARPVAGGARYTALAEKVPAVSRPDGTPTL